MHTQKGRPRDLTRDDLDRAIMSICRKNKSQDEYIISVHELTSELEIEFDIDVDPVTVRRRGVCKSGYYEKKYPEICSYQPIGDTRFRGLVIKPEKFIEEVSE